MTKTEIAKQAREAAITFSSIKMVDSLDTLSDKCTEWENGAYKTATDILYGLLGECLDIYNQKFLKADRDVQAAFRTELIRRLQADGMRVVKTTLTLHLLVRYAFKSDRRRAHAYGYVLRAAVAEGVEGKDLADFIRAAGGVEEIRRKQVLSEEALRAREQVAAAVSDVLAEIERNSADPLGVIPAPANEELKEFCVVLGRPAGDGTIALVSVLSDVPDSMLTKFKEKVAKVRLEQAAMQAQNAKEATDMQAPQRKFA